MMYYLYFQTLRLSSIPPALTNPLISDAAPYRTSPKDPKYPWPQIELNVPPILLLHRGCEPPTHSALRIMSDSILTPQGCSIILCHSSPSSPGLHCPSSSCRHSCSHLFICQFLSTHHVPFMF